MKGKLILVATPIGNLKDMSIRAIEAMQKSDFIAAEDTRVAVKILNYFGIKKPMISYFEHNKGEKDKYILEKILSGETCALVSDAGMPAISDPGETLVKTCAKNNIAVSVIPGPCALISALAISGLSTGRFTFEGFLSVNKKNRFEHLKSLKYEYRTMIFYEAPHKLLRTLRDLFNAFGNRKITLVKELTKIHEEVIRTDLENAIKKYEFCQIKGEFVLIIEGLPSGRQQEKITLPEAIKIAQKLLNNGYSVSEAVKQTARITELKKNDIYKALI